MDQNSKKQQKDEKAYIKYRDFVNQENKRRMLDKAILNNSALPEAMAYQGGPIHNSPLCRYRRRLQLEYLKKEKFLRDLDSKLNSSLSEDSELSLHEVLKDLSAQNENSNLEHYVPQKVSDYQRKDYQTPLRSNPATLAVPYLPLHEAKASQNIYTPSNETRNRRKFKPRRLFAAPSSYDLPSINLQPSSHRVTIKPIDTFNEKFLRSHKVPQSHNKTEYAPRSLVPDHVQALTEEIESSGDLTPNLYENTSRIEFGEITQIQDAPDGTRTTTIFMNPYQVLDNQRAFSKAQGIQTFARRDIDYDKLLWDNLNEFTMDGRARGYARDWRK